MIDTQASEQLTEIWQLPVDGGLFWPRLLDVVEPHWHQILKRKNVPNHDIDDVVGKIRVKLLEFLPKKKEGIEDPKAWLSQVANNAARQYHREEWRRTDRLVQMSERLEDNLPAEQTDQEVERRRAAMADTINAMLNDKLVDDISKTVFTLFIYHGRTNKEISNDIDMSERTVNRNKAIAIDYIKTNFFIYYNKH